MPKRTYCDTCQYPEKTCICDVLAGIHCPSFAGDIHILQHPKEAQHSKNSVRMLKLLMPEITLWHGELPSDFTHLQQQIATSSARWACIFPSPQSQPIENSSTSMLETRLIFIDATWRKARKMWYLNPWLQQLPCWHLPESSQQQYHIRKSPQEHHLSTLEAVALTLQKDWDSEPLLLAFKQFQQHFYQFANR